MNESKTNGGKKDGTEPVDGIRKCGVDGDDENRIAGGTSKADIDPRAAGCIAVHGDPGNAPEESSLWGVRERVRNALAERRAAFHEWVRGQTMFGILDFMMDNVRMPEPVADGEEENDDARDGAFFFENVPGALSHVKLAEGFRLAARLVPCWGEYRAAFFAVRGRSFVPLETVLCLDGSPDSYWEAAMLHFETGEFYRFGHANYESKSIVPGIDRFVREFSFCGFYGREIFESLSPEARRRLCEMDFRPTAEARADGGTVGYVVFAPFRGFARYCLHIVPRRCGVSLSVHGSGYVPYRCPIMF